MERRLRLPFILFLFWLAASVLADPATLARRADGRWQLPDSATYQGPLVDGLFEGRGTLEWANGDRYEGEFHRGLFHGQGRLTLTDGSTYEGEFRNGMLNGQGVYTGPDQGRYTGAFRDGMFHGQGRYADPDGTIFEGRFARNAPDGQGTIRYADGGIYTGAIRRWRRHGQGEYRFGDDFILRGHFENDELTGAGEIIDNGGRYRGELRAGIPHGKGELERRDGTRYSGDFRDGQYHGHGRLVTADGDVFEGEFREGLQHGEGTLYRKHPHGHKRALHGYWFMGRYVGETPVAPEARVAALRERQARAAEVDAEATFYRQPALLKQHLAKLQPGTPGVIDIYLLSFGAWGDQDVFMKEASLARELFTARFAAAGHTVTLINNPRLVRSLPLASVTNLSHALERLAEVMDEEDILVLYLTSHGSREHELAVSLADLPLNDLSAKRLAELLAKSGIRWKVVIVSACYSGGFIDPLDDGNTLVMTSAAADRVSFGCSDEADLTYFGRALLKHGLQQTRDFDAAFRIAADLIRDWEAAEDYDHSRPRFHSTPAIEAQLATWRRQHLPATALGQTAH